MRRLVAGSLKVRILAMTLAVVTLAQVANGWLTVNDNRVLMETTTRQRLEAIAAMSAEALARPMWDFDTRQIESMLEALGASEVVSEARLLDPDGRLMRTAGSVAPGEETLYAAADVVFETGEGAAPLGRLEIRQSRSALDATIARLTRHTAMLSAFMLAGVCLAVISIGGRATRPLAGLSAAIAAIREGRLDRPTPYADRTDEVGEVARALESFRQNAAEVERLRGENDRLAGEERQRTLLALESMSDATVILDETGRVVFANAAAKALLPELAPGGHYWALTRIPDEEQAQLRQAIEQRRQLSLETVLERAPRRSRHVALRVEPMGEAPSRFLGSVVRVADISERIEAQAQIVRLAERDHLTGLPNRRMFEGALRKRLSGGKTPVAVLVMDLDRFKAVNDLHGHPVGDDLLISVARLLQRIVPEQALLARTGGDEFAVLFDLPDDDPDPEATADAVASRIVRRLSDPVIADKRHLWTGASVGMLLARPGAVAASEVIRRAELAMHAAKQRGRGRGVFFEHAMAQDLARRARLEEELRDAIARREITIAFQPQIRVTDRRLAGFEALARWTHPTLGAISPGEFIALAEERGLIADLSRLVFKGAFEAAAAWHTAGFRGHVAVNVSPVLFREDVVAMIDAALARSGCPPEAVEVEITETVLLSDELADRKVFDALRSRGIRIAIDDFGTGYSSLGYLSRFPLDRIKIDRAFVRELGETERAGAIITAIAELGHALGMQVTAEGVETDDQAAALGRSGVDTLQGFLLGRPEPRKAADEAVLDDAFAGADAPASPPATRQRLA